MQHANFVTFTGQLNPTHATREFRHIYRTIESTLQQANFVTFTGPLNPTHATREFLQIYRRIKLQGNESLTFNQRKLPVTIFL